MAEERILDRIAKMLERANHPNTPEAERQVCLDMANSMMVKHAIEQAEMDARLTPNERRRPTKQRVHMFDPTGWYSAYFQTILHTMQETNRVRIALHHNGDCTIVGFNDDVNWTEMLWLHIFREFVSRIDPRWDAAQSFDYNVKALKEAGWKWWQIWNAIPGEKPCPCPPKDGGYLIRAYKRECKRVGQDTLVQTQKFGAYRATFAHSFTTTICRRLRDQAQSNSEEAAASKALVVSLGDVDDLFYETFPSLKPESEEEKQARWAAEAEQRRLEQEKDAAWLASLSERERVAELNRRQAEERKLAAASDRYWRDQEKRQAALYDSDGLRAGRRAAEAVKMDRTTQMDDNKKGELQ